MRDYGKKARRHCRAGDRAAVLHSRCSRVHVEHEQQQHLNCDNANERERANDKDIKQYKCDAWRIDNRDARAKFYDNAPDKSFDGI